ncbi:MAG: hypothetical protein ACP6IS_10230 [Candidatus Asgardarchaeia archaeon]
MRPLLEREKFEEVKHRIIKLIERLPSNRQLFGIAKIVKIFLSLRLRAEAEEILFLFGNEKARTISELVLDDYVLRDPMNITDSLLQIKNIHSKELFLLGYALFEYFEEIGNKEGIYLATTLIYESENYVNKKTKDVTLVRLAKRYIIYGDYDSSITAAVGITNIITRFKTLIAILDSIITRYDEITFYDDLDFFEVDDLDDLKAEILEELRYCIDSIKTEEQLSKIATVVLRNYARKNNRIYTELIKEIVRRASSKGYKTLRKRLETKYKQYDYSSDEDYL